jgi:hypothetical protein
LYKALPEQHLATHEKFIGKTSFENNDDNASGGTIPAIALKSHGFKIPEDQYAYNADMNSEANETSLAIINKETDLHKATETLEPHEQIVKKIQTMQNTMKGLTSAFEGTKKALAKVDGREDFIYKSVDIKPAYNKPSESYRYPALDTIFNAYTDDLDTIATYFRKEASKILTDGQRTKLFMLRLERANVLFHTHLTKILGPIHAACYQTLNKIETTKDSPSNHDLAVVAVRRLLEKIDLELLAYLDINREPLITDFVTVNKPKAYMSLTKTDWDTVDFITTTILGYIKAATCCKHIELSVEQQKRQALAKLVALIESEDAKLAITATDKAMAEAKVPKDMIALNQAIDNRLMQHHADAKPASKPTSKKRKANNNNNNSANKTVRFENPKDKAGPKNTPAKATQSTGTNNNSNSSNKKGKGKGKGKNKGNNTKNQQQKKKPPEKKGNN